MQRHDKLPASPGDSSASLAVRSHPAATAATVIAATTLQGEPASETPPTRVLVPLEPKGSETHLLESVSPGDVAAVLNREHPRPGKLQDNLIFKINFLIGDDDIFPEDRPEFIAKALVKLRELVPEEKKQVVFILHEGKSWVETLLRSFTTPSSSIAGAVQVLSTDPIQEMTKTMLPAPPYMPVGNHTAHTVPSTDHNEKMMISASGPGVRTYGTMVDTGAKPVGFRRIIVDKSVYLCFAVFVVVCFSSGYYFM
ncbi:hypothetical protein N0V90_001544 [Kalmusia sp. IMI 367209]|nr:hypothetical protein N0V90_001544 [Kalmusia sp. IMI 367209]